jgi:Holliday junction resolvase RusA-like endonuclease
MMRRVVIPGDPVAKGRPRSSARGGRVIVRTPERTRRAEAWVAACAADAAQTGPMVGPLVLRAVFSRVRPKRLRRKSDPRGAVWAPTKPDTDNYLKLLKDGLKALWGDDAQVVHVEAAKVYAPIGCEPCTVVDVWPAGDVPAWALDMLDAAQAASDGGAP